MAQSWTLEEGLTLIRAVQEKAKTFGYHITLGGSVLNAGKSLKDLDLYFHPFRNPQYPENDTGLISWLTELWGTPRRMGLDYIAEEIQQLEPMAILANMVNEDALFDPPPQPAAGVWYNLDGPVAPLAPAMAPPAPPAEPLAVPFQGQVPPAGNPQFRVANRLNELEQQYGYRAYAAGGKPKKAPGPVYKWKMKFERGGDDRIDVFII